MTKRTRKPVKAQPEVQKTPSPDEERQALEAAQERLLARRVAQIPLQIMDDWPLSPFGGEDVIPRSSVEVELVRLTRQPRLRLRRWAAHGLEQLRLSPALLVTVNRVRWNDLKRYVEVTDQLPWPEGCRHVLVDTYGAGFEVHPLEVSPRGELSCHGEPLGRHLVFDGDGEWAWSEMGNLWLPYVATLPRSSRKPL